METNPPIKIVQFGEGNFLRAFIDWMIDIMNEKNGFEAGVVVVQPIKTGLVNLLQQQNGQYHHVVQGISSKGTTDEIRRIGVIRQMIDPFIDTTSFYNLSKRSELKLVFSNTTEAGIQFDDKDVPENDQLALTFPGKLTQFLKKRFDHFIGSSESGLSILPCELIEYNGEKLRTCIEQYSDLWELGDDFKMWLHRHNHFANTLVDRIVPGYPKEEMDALRSRLTFEDKLVVKSEVFHLFIIQGNDHIQKAFPADRAGLNVKFVDDIKPFRTQKVRILNGTHTSMVPIGLLMGLETVMEAMNDKVLGPFLERMIYDEIVPTINIPGEDPALFADEVLDRFRNPFIRHELTSIALNSISKFKVRVLPTLLDYHGMKNAFPEKLMFAFACLICLYLEKSERLNDDPEYLAFFNKLSGTHKEKIPVIFANQDFWGQDLNAIQGFTEMIQKNIEKMDKLKETLTQMIS